MSELKKKLIFWRTMSFFTAVGGVFYVVKYEMDFVFMIIFVAFAMMFHITETIKKLLKEEI